MASEARTIELAEVGDLAALVDEVRRSRRPQILRRDGEDLAVLVPMTMTSARRSGYRMARLRPPAAEEIERSRAGITEAAGSWQDIDVEGLKDDLRRQRDIATRPSVEL
jgi:hypothetical protein